MLYHRRLGFPPNVAMPRGVHRIQFTQHAIDAAADDFIFDLPMYVDFSKSRVIEAAIENGKVCKVLVRVRGGENIHLVLALKIQEFSPLICKTLFVNDKRDNHKTLRRSAYATV